MDNKFTSEEKLLKIIEGPVNKKERSKLNPKERFAFLQSITAYIEEWLTDKNKVKSLLNLHVINKALTALCILFTLVLLFDFIKGYAAIKNRMQKLEKTVMEASTEEEKFLPIINLNAMLKDADSRNIFTLFAPTKEAKAVTEMNQMIANFKLVGIIWSDNPQAMVEDAKTGKTYLLSESEMLGDFKVKKILRDKVIIGKDEMEWELR